MEKQLIPIHSMIPANMNNAMDQAQFLQRQICINSGNFPFIMANPVPTLQNMTFTIGSPVIPTNNSPTKEKTISTEVKSLINPFEKPPVVKKFKEDGSSPSTIEKLAQVLQLYETAKPKPIDPRVKK